MIAMTPISESADSDLLSQLSSPDPEVRLLTVKKIGVMHYSPVFVNPLIKLINDPNAEIRRTAIVTLGAIGDVHAINPIITALDDKEEFVVLAVIKTLGEMRTPLAVKPLIKFCSHSKSKIRTAVAIALGHIADKTALFPLIELLSDETLEVRLSAILALGLIGDSRAVIPIVGLLKDDNPQIVSIAAFTLGKFKDLRSMEPLIQALSSPYSKIRQCAVISLGALKDPKIIDPIVKLMNDEEPDVQRTAANVLAELNNKSIIDHFIDRLIDPNPCIQETAAKALGKYKDPKALPYLINALEDPKIAKLEPIIDAIGELGDAESLKALYKMFKDKSTSIRTAAVRAVGKIQGPLSYRPLSSEKRGVLKTISKIGGLTQDVMSLQPLNKMLKDTEMPVRNATAIALAKINLNQLRFDKAQEYYGTAAEETLAWDYHQDFWKACAQGMGILKNILEDQYKTNRGKFIELLENIQSSAKMRRIDYASEKLWQAVECFNNLTLIDNYEQYIQLCKDYAVNLVMLQKRIPEDLATFFDAPQERLNSIFQTMESDKIQLKASSKEYEILKEDLFEITIRVLQLEPIEFRSEETELTVGLVQNLITGSVKDQTITPKTTRIMADFSPLPQMPNNLPTKTTKNFNIDKVEIGKDPLTGPVKIALIQPFKGAIRQKLIEDTWEFYRQGIERYYDIKNFEEVGVFTFKKEAINLSIKPKIIGFLDDAIYQGANVCVLPEGSVPFEYLDKLQEFADHFKIYIIAGVESIQDGNWWFKRAYVFAPSDKAIFQQKNFQNVLPPSEKHFREWKENIRVTTPPLIEIFSAPFGRFVILMGQDIKELGQYLGYIHQNYQLNFVFLLTNGYEEETDRQKYKSWAKDLKIPVFYVNTGQFGETQNFNSITTPLHEQTEGFLLF